MEVFPEPGPSSRVDNGAPITQDALQNAFARLFGQSPTYEAVERVTSAFQVALQAFQSIPSGLEVAPLNEEQLAACELCAKAGLGEVLYQRSLDGLRSKLTGANQRISDTYDTRLPIDWEDEPVGFVQVRYFCHLLARDLLWLQALQRTATEVSAFQLEFRTALRAAAEPLLLEMIHKGLGCIFWSLFFVRDAYSDDEEWDGTFFTNLRTKQRRLSPREESVPPLDRLQHLFILRVRALGLRLILHNALDGILQDAAIRLADAAAQDTERSVYGGAAIRSEDEIRMTMGADLLPCRSLEEQADRYFPSLFRAPESRRRRLDLLEPSLLPLALHAMQLRHAIAAPLDADAFDFIEDYQNPTLASTMSDSPYDAPELFPDVVPWSDESKTFKIDLPRHLQSSFEHERRFLESHAYRRYEGPIISLFFDSIKLRKGQKAALVGLRNCISSSGRQREIVAELNEIIGQRLLHPGAQTQDIIEFFVLLIHSLRGGLSMRNYHPNVILSHLAHPIRRYLRSRPDTVTVIVSSLLGNRESFALLREELEKARGAKTPFSLEATKIRAADDDDDEDDSDDERDVAMDASARARADLAWRPKPIGAGPKYRKTAQGDVIGMLVSIFDDREGFITALERTMAEQLLQVRDYQHVQQYESNTRLKKRFGETHFARIDIMLQDLAASKDFDHAMRDRPFSAPGLQPDERAIVRALHPIVISRQCWPDLTGEAGASHPLGEAIGGGMGTGTAPPSYLGVTAGSSSSKNGLGGGDTGLTGTLRVPGAAVAQHKLPSRLQTALDAYTDIYKSRKQPQTMRFLPGLGTMSLKLTMADGRVVEADGVTALQASVVEHAAGKGTNAVVTAAEIAAELEVDKTSALNALYFWVNKVVIVELSTAAESFQVLDIDEEKQ